MKCGICHYVSTGDGKGHTARTCPLNQLQCQRDLPEGHPLRLPGQCVDKLCVHNKTCPNCGLDGHLFGTQAITVERYKLNPNTGGLLRKVNPSPLSPSDFVCLLHTSVSVGSMVNNSQHEATAKAVDAEVRRVSTSRLSGNIHSQKLDIDETVRLMEVKGSDAALLNTKNKKSFITLAKHAHLGAIAAGHVAAEAAESSLDELSDDSGAGANVDDRAVETKAVRGLRKGTESRTDRYAAAVFKSRHPLRRPGQPRIPKSKARESRAETIDVEAASSRPLPPPPAPASSWPKGTRLEFEKALPAFSSPSFASRTPVSIAHSVLETMCHCPVLDIEKELAATVIKGAIDNHLRGYVLTSGTLCAAQVAEWLCCNMPESMRAATVSTVARALDKVVTNAAAVAAEATGSQAPVCGQ